jgi:hypothetical protein
VTNILEYANERFQLIYEVVYKIHVSMTMAGQLAQKWGHDMHHAHVQISWILLRNAMAAAAVKRSI